MQIVSQRPTRQHQRHGIIAVFAALFIVVFAFLLACSIDVGYMCNVRDELQRAADAGALAGGGDLVRGTEAAISTGMQFAMLNGVEQASASASGVAAKTTSSSGVQYMVMAASMDSTTATNTSQGLTGSQNIVVEIGTWNKTTRTFLSGQTPADAVRVMTRRTGAPFFFARAVGQVAFDMSATAVATAQPRDIILVLDYSGSMLDDGKIDAMKDAVTLLVSYMQLVPGQDRIGFVRYSDIGELKAPLTLDLSSVDQTVRSTTAKGSTNIGDGMSVGRTELTTYRRPNAKPMMVLMTDGIATRPTTNPVQYVRDQAAACAAAKIPVIAISFGNDADTTLMQYVADTTSGVHFYLAGTVAEQEAELRKVFQNVAENRPLILVD